MLELHVDGFDVCEVKVSGNYVDITRRRHFQPVSPSTTSMTTTRGRGGGGWCSTRATDTVQGTVKAGHTEDATGTSVLTTSTLTLLHQHSTVSFGLFSVTSLASARVWATRSWTGQRPERRHAQGVGITATTETQHRQNGKSVHDY